MKYLLILILLTGCESVRLHHYVDLQLLRHEKDLDVYEDVRTGKAFYLPKGYFKHK